MWSRIRQHHRCFAVFRGVHVAIAKELTGVRGILSIRQWHAYPNILPEELYSDEVKNGEKFETL